MTPMIAAIWAAGGIQLVIAAANVEVARQLDYRANLSRLTPMVGQVFLVHAVYIVLLILWFSALCLLFAARLASGDPLARFLTGGLAAFWGLRAIIQLTVYDKKVRKDHRLQDVAFLAACALLTGIFLAAALH
ncbi:MAG TPA: hypothetical protein VN973_03850 [Candidatus Dormibacteraeota bacterium]|nr:hypothetical protein [Candidatus Dormibacteraeota bacterium]